MQEASNGHSPLAPLYHYWRTGDARFLRATGGLVASHVFLNSVGRKEIIQTVRAFHDTIGTGRSGCFQLHGGAFVTRMTMASVTGPGQEEARRTTVGDELRFAFHHAWISTRVAKFAPDGDAMTRTPLRVVRREMNRQRPDDQFSVEHGMESGLPTIWTSHYAAKSLVAYVPVLAAHLAATKRKP